MKGAGPVLVTDVVLAEALWTLSGKRYRAGKDALEAVVESLFQEPSICFENNAVVWRALADWREAGGGKRSAPDFADALIIAKARHAARAQGAPFSGMATFDKAAQGLPGVLAAK